MNYKICEKGVSTTCSKSGIKIHESKSNNDNKQYSSTNSNRPSQLSNPVDFHNTTLDSLDLDLDNYSLNDLYHLFNISEGLLNETTLKNAKNITLKMHPDKSRLHQKYFLFFSRAYKRIYGIYEFQNKSIEKTYKDEDFFDESNRNVLNHMFDQNKDFKDPKNFNNWFNESFEKHKVNNQFDNGYGDWLKTDEGIMNINENVTKGNMNEIFEQKKKQIQSLSVYTGVTDMVASSLGGSLLNEGENYSASNYTDLRQAYTETLIPVTHEDYTKIQKFNNISEYKAHRDKVDLTPLSYDETNRQLLRQHNQKEQESAALAFKYAQEAERNKQTQQSFWGDIKQLKR